MEIICYQDGSEFYYVYLDQNFRIVELPTKYFMSINNHGIFYSENSIKHYSKVLLYFTNYLEKNFQMPVDMTLETLNGTDISDYLKSLKVNGLVASTIRNREAIIREFLTWLTSEESGRIRLNNGYSSKQYKSPKPMTSIPKYLTVFEVMKFIHCLHDESQRCLVHFLFDSGLRISEIKRVKKIDIPNLQDYPDDTMYFDFNVKGSKGRGGNIKDRITFISRAMISRINRLHKQHPVYRKARRNYSEEDMPCFLNLRGNPITEDAIKNLLFRNSKRGGFKTSKYTAHCFRHSFAVSVLMSEFDTEFLNKLVIVRDALGHEDISTTEVYSRIPAAAIKNLQRQNQQHDIINRFEESQYIMDHTYLPLKNHTEKRGRIK